MKLLRTIQRHGACAAVVAAMLPTALLAAPKVDAGALAGVDALVDLCTQKNPNALKGAPDFVGKVSRGAKPEDLKAARDSDAYKDTYAALHAQMTQFDAKDIAKACTDAARSK